MKRERHGDSKTRLHTIWRKMRYRCTNPKAHNYKYYGAKGVKVCQEWDSYLAFKKWALANGYTKDLSIDRKESNGNYEPSNCRWVTQTIQTRNTGKQLNNTSGFRGVSLSKGKWLAQIVVNGKQIYLGRRDTKELSARLYDGYIIKHELEHTRNFNDS